MNTAPLMTESVPGTSPVTDGAHVLVDALKLNGVETLYGVVGIPITDVARVHRHKACATSASGTRATPGMPPPQRGS